MKMNVCADYGRPRDEKSKIFCVQCEIPLCNQCGFKLFCKTHFDQLSLDTQKEMNYWAQKELLRDKIMGFIIFLIVSSFIFGLILMFVLNNYFLLLICLIPVIGSIFYMMFTDNALEVHLGHQASILQKQQITMQFPNEIYKCSVCGHGAPVVHSGRAGSRPFRCIACNNDLCPNHYFEGFCPTHSAILSKTAKSTILKLERQSQHALYGMFIAITVGSVLIGIVAVLIYSEISYFFGIVFFGPMIGGFFYINRREHIKSEIVKQEEARYLSEGGTIMVSAEVNQAILDRQKKNEEENYLKRTRWVCSNCGAQNSGKTQFCVQCLKKK